MQTQTRKKLRKGTIWLKFVENCISFFSGANDAAQLPNLDNEHKPKGNIWHKIATFFAQHQVPQNILKFLKFLDNKIVRLVTGILTLAFYSIGLTIKIICAALKIEKKLAAGKPITTAEKFLVRMKDRFNFIKQEKLNEVFSDLFFTILGFGLVLAGSLVASGLVAGIIGIVGAVLSFGLSLHDCINSCGDSRANKKALVTLQQDHRALQSEKVLLKYISHLEYQLNQVMIKEMQLPDNDTSVISINKLIAEKKQEYCNSFDKQCPANKQERIEQLSAKIQENRLIFKTEEKKHHNKFTIFHKLSRGTLFACNTIGLLSVGLIFFGALLGPAGLPLIGAGVLSLFGLAAIGLITGISLATYTLVNKNKKTAFTEKQEVAAPEPKVQHDLPKTLECVAPLIKADKRRRVSIGPSNHSLFKPANALAKKSLSMPDIKRPTGPRP